MFHGRSTRSSQQPPPSPRFESEAVPPVASTAPLTTAAYDVIVGGDVHYDRLKEWLVERGLVANNWAQRMPNIRQSKRLLLGPVVGRLAANALPTLSTAVADAANRLSADRTDASADAAVSGVQAAVRKLGDFLASLTPTIGGGTESTADFICGYLTDNPHVADYFSAREISDQLKNVETALQSLITAYSKHASQSLLESIRHTAEQQRSETSHSLIGRRAWAALSFLGITSSGDAQFNAIDSTAANELSTAVDALAADCSQQQPSTNEESARSDADRICALAAAGKSVVARVASEWTTRVVRAYCENAPRGTHLADSATALIKIVDFELRSLENELSFVQREERTARETTRVDIARQRLEAMRALQSAFDDLFGKTPNQTHRRRAEVSNEDVSQLLALGRDDLERRLLALVSELDSHWWPAVVSAFYGGEPETTHTTDDWLTLLRFYQQSAAFTGSQSPTDRRPEPPESGGTETIRELPTLAFVARFGFVAPPLKYFRFLFAAYQNQRQKASATTASIGGAGGSGAASKKQKKKKAQTANQTAGDQSRPPLSPTAAATDSSATSSRLLIGGIPADLYSLLQTATDADLAELEALIEQIKSSQSESKVTTEQSPPQQPIESSAADTRNDATDNEPSIDWGDDIDVEPAPALEIDWGDDLDADQSNQTFEIRTVESGFAADAGLQSESPKQQQTLRNQCADLLRRILVPPATANAKQRLSAEQTALRLVDFVVNELTRDSLLLSRDEFRFAFTNDLLELHAFLSTTETLREDSHSAADDGQLLVRDVIRGWKWQAGLKPPPSEITAPISERISRIVDVLVHNPRIRTLVLFKSSNQAVVKRLVREIQGKQEAVVRAEARLTAVDARIAALQERIARAIKPRIASAISRAKRLQRILEIEVGAVLSEFRSTTAAADSRKQQRWRINIQGKINDL